MIDQIIDTWNINNRINLYLLESLEEPALEAMAAGGKGRTVGEQFAHLHGVRLMWLKVGAPDLMTQAKTLGKEDVQDKKALMEALTTSGRLIAEMLTSALEQGKLKGFKPHPTAALGYFVAHDAHHRGQILLCLKQSGIKVDKKISYGMWEWGAR